MAYILIGPSRKNTMRAASQAHAMSVAVGMPAKDAPP
jgi:hypothetical protein